MLGLRLKCDSELYIWLYGVAINEAIKNCVREIKPHDIIRLFYSYRFKSMIQKHEVCEFYFM